MTQGVKEIPISGQDDSAKSLGLFYQGGIGCPLELGPTRVVTRVPLIFEKLRRLLGEVLVEKKGHATAS